MLISWWRQWSANKRIKQTAYAEYSALVARARAPHLFEKGGLEDTLDGRFEAIVLHLFLHKKQQTPAQTKTPGMRYIQEAFIDDMDRSLREMGVGDMGVSVRIKKMVSALYGRLQAYEESWDDEAQFNQALIRNAYRGKALAPETLSHLSTYLRNYPTTTTP